MTWLFGKKQQKSRVHNIKNQFAREMLQVHLEAKKLQEQAEALEKKIRNTTAYKVAVATGRTRH